MREVLITWKGARDKLKDKKTGRQLQPKKPSEQQTPPQQKHFRGTFDIEEVKRRTRCKKCKKKGHWHRECPERNKDKDKKIKGGGGGSSSSGSGFFAFAEE